MTGEQEREANVFAMHLLMPEKLVRKEVARMGGVDLTSDEGVKKLAIKFQVSVPMMTLRLGQIYEELK